MGQPVKLSDALVLDARQTGALAERSIAGQIEYWARLGRAVELVLPGEWAMALRSAGDEQPLSEFFASVDSATGRERLARVLGRRPYPHYEPAAGKRGLLIRIESDGSRTEGQFIDGEFREGPPRPVRTGKAKKSGQSHGRAKR